MITNITNNTSNYKRPTFGGAIDGIATQVLRTLDTNPMVNAVGIDLFAMVGPRTYIDTKERNANAGFETFFREFTGTLIVCLSASYLAKGISKLANKIISPEIPINTNSWFSNDSIALLIEAHKNTHKTTDYVANILENITGRDGKKINKFIEIDWENTEWVNDEKWSKFHWENPKFKNIAEELKSKDKFISTISELIDNKNISKNDAKQLHSILEFRLTNALKSDKINVKINDKTLSTSMNNILRDAIDLGKNVFTNTKIDPTKAINKILKINKIKGLGALAIASTLGLTNQYINRKLTEKRTGQAGFPGDSNYKGIDEKSKKDNSAKFWGMKAIAALGMAAMALGVMKIKSPADFVKKLEFTGPVTSGNAIKTVYASTLIGRFLASDNKRELKETATRDYFGFLNWLVLGGFAAKGVANILDPKRKDLFNISSDGKGIRNWLNNISLKSHNEVLAKGTKFAQKNMWKLNLAHVAGLAYSTLALGVLLPKLNIYLANHSSKNNNALGNKPAIQMQKVSMTGFLNDNAFSKIA